MNKGKFISRRMAFCTIAPVLGSLLVACSDGGSSSGSSSSGSTPNTSNTGQFIDSEVVNIAYRTESLSGVTNENGEFRFKDGETVTFMIGDIELPATNAKDLITPLDIAGTSDLNDTRVINISRLLQSLDTDGNPDNGITIDDLAHDNAVGYDIDFSAGTFDADIGTLLPLSGSVTTTLIDANTATAHLQSSLDELTTAFSTSLFTNSEVYNVFIEDDGRWVIAGFTFHTDGSISWDYNGEQGTGSYTFSHSDRVIILNDNNDEDFYEYVVFKSFNLGQNLYSVCWYDDEDVTDADVALADCDGKTDALDELLLFDIQQAIDIVNNKNQGGTGGIINTSTFDPFETSKFIGETVYNPYEDDDTWALSNIQFATDGTFIYTGDDEVVNGQYEFTDNDFVLNLMFTEAGRQQHNYLLVYENDTDQNIYSLCWVDNATDAANAASQCPPESNDHSEFFVFDEAQAEQIVTNQGAAQ